MSSSTERIQDSTAAVKRLATKYNCDIVGRNLADNLVEIKRKNKRALDDLKLHCEVSLARNDDKLAASNRRADDIENAARPTAMETFKWEHNNATADFESVESEHSEIVRNHKHRCVETEVALENATLELADADEALASTSKIIEMNALLVKRCMIRGKHKLARENQGLSLKASSVKIRESTWPRHAGIRQRLSVTGCTHE